MTKAAWAIFWLFVLWLFIYLSFPWLFHSEQELAEGRAANFEKRVMTDPKTGCQYVHGGRGAVTPRLGVDGKPICR